MPGHIPASPDPRLASWLGLGPASSPRTCLTITGLSADPGYCRRTCSACLAWGLWDGDLAGEAAVSVGSVVTFPGGAASSCCSLMLNVLLPMGGYHRLIYVMYITNYDL